jgi:adenylate cyclase
MIDQGIRILAAIMFTDIVGYTAMMQENEANAKSLRDRHRNVLENETLMHRGKILQYYGDGTLSIFGSAIEAVKCAVEIQKEFNKEPKIPLRIGIHLGDIVYEDSGVYGDGVNVTARIQSLSVPGGVLISEKVFDEIKNQDNLNCISLGEFELKNVKRPLEIYALTGEGINTPDIQTVKEQAGFHKKSIAVLPFINMSADPENEYFSDGITEEIINALTKVKGLRVTSRTSSFKFKNKNEDIREIGNQLNVNTVLEGSVRKAGNRVRVTAQLINTNDGYHHWSEVYDRKLEDIFALQDEVSLAITKQLQETLSAETKKEHLVKPYTKNIKAYNHYLKGLYYWNKWTPTSMNKAIGFFQEAIMKEPDFALPYAGLANCYSYLGAYGIVKPREAYPKAREAALKALTLDNTRFEPFVALALVKFFYDWDWEGTENDFRFLLKNYSGYADVHYAYALFLMSTGKFTEAVLQMEKAHMIDPLSLPINMYLATAYSHIGRYQEAIDQINKTLELDPDFQSAYYQLGVIYHMKGEIQKSIETFEKLYTSTGHSVACLSYLGYAYSQSGDREKVISYLAELHERSNPEKQISLNFDFAVVYAGLGEYEKSLDYLDMAYEEKLGGLVFIKNSPLFKHLKDHPRFITLLKKMGMTVDHAD